MCGGNRPRMAAVSGTRNADADNRISVELPAWCRSHRSRPHEAYVCQPLSSATSWIQMAMEHAGAGLSEEIAVTKQAYIWLVFGLRLCLYRM